MFGELCGVFGEATSCNWATEGTPVEEVITSGKTGTKIRWETKKNLSRNWTPFFRIEIGKENDSMMTGLAFWDFW